MTNRMIDADALLRWVKTTKGLFDDETLDDFYLSTIEKINELSLDVPKQYVDVNVLKSQLLKITFPRQYGHMPYYKQIMDKIQSVIGSIATPVESQENCKSNLTKFTMQLFETIGQNVEAGKIEIDDDSFDKMEKIAFMLIDAIKIQAPAKGETE